MKTEVLDVIGEAALQRPVRVNAALAANDRVKYLLSLLQVAIAQADHPGQPADTLQRERIGCGIDDPAFDAMVGSARREDSRYHLPGAAAALARLAQEMRVMAAPVIEAPDTETPDIETRDTAGWARRLESLLRAVPVAQDDLVDGAAVTRMAQAAGPQDDSLHQLVMDLHKALNAMQAALAEEHLDGAAVYGLLAEDRSRVAAFMAGLNRTAPLKFNHPGLGTTATRSGTRLVIQNDIGTTDAHVIVIHVEGLAAEVTYSDVHPERAQFMREMLARFPVRWSGMQSHHVATLAEGEAFTLSTGRFEAADDAALLAYLTWLGSRLVFLIDWNRARKQLRSFLHDSQRAVLLRWAAENEIGHRGFLELGGAALINEAIEATAGSAMHFGDQLCDVLGDEATMDFLRFVLRACSEGLLARRSHALIRDRVRTDLAAHFSNEARRLLLMAGDHAGLVFEIATLVRDGVHTAGLLPAPPGLAPRARRFEHDADQFVLAVREIVRRRPGHAPLLALVEAADDAADHLEECAFLLELLARSKPSGAALTALGALAELLLEAAEEWVKTLAHAPHVGRAADAAGTQDDVDDFLTAIDRVSDLEHQADDAERALTYAAVQHAEDFRQLHLYAEMGGGLEEAADALKRASFLARDHILGAMLNG